MSESIFSKSIHFKSALVAFALLVSAAILSVLATPHLKTGKVPKVLEEVIPQQIGDWVNIPTPYAQVSVNADPKSLVDIVYDQILMRTYKDNVGNEIMLALAFANEQRQEIKIHQPEICYPAQGYSVDAINSRQFDFVGYNFPIDGKQVIFRKNDRMEAVSYWIRVGDSFPQSGFAMRYKIFKAGLRGNIEDGILVRVSSVITDIKNAPEAYKIQEKFLAELVEVTKVPAPDLLVPTSQGHS